jgi:acyl-CoA reductase-like NAD-dependent aldehyde dehydrogenase
MATASGAEALVQADNRLWIDGEWASAASGGKIDVINPATGQVFASLAAGTSADIATAAASARRSFRSGAWRKLTGAERGRILWRLSDLLERDAESLARIETLDCGMPLTRTRVHLSRGIEAIRYYAGMCTKIHGRTAELSGPDIEYHSYVRREPVGVVGMITPWNGPLLVVCNKVAPALAAGCSVIVKPPEDTSLTALAFARLAAEAGVPAGVVNVVTGTGLEAGAALAAHPDVNKISFTGSTAVGKELVRASAGNLKRLSLELGGKSPVFVFDDADMELAIPVCFRAIFANSGQVCVAGSRLYVQKGSIDRVVSGLKQLAEATRLGNGLDPRTELGPLVSQRHRERVMRYIRSGLEEGVELVTGGRMPAQDGYFVEPTIFLNARKDATIMREEIFGPVLNIVPFDSIDEVEELGNATPYGLAAGIFTRDLSTAHRAAKLLEVGNVWVNCYGIMDYAMPFGGFKQSGWGRENGFDGIDAFLEDKSIYVRI